MKRVLLAEDDPDTAAVIKATLEERLPITVDHVTNGALVSTRSGRPSRSRDPDVSCRLNGIDVFDLHAEARRARVPVLFLTAMPDRAGKRCARGTHAVMAKPFDADALVARVDDLLARAVRVA